MTLPPRRGSGGGLLWVILLAIILLAAYAFLSLADAAIVVPFRLTAPADYLDSTRTNPVRCTAYEAVWCDGGECVGKNLWAGPRGWQDGTALPREPGAIDTVWAVYSSDPVFATHGVLLLRAVDAAGNVSGWSNAARLATFVRDDTLLAVTRLDTTFIAWADTGSVDGVALAGHQHAPGDTMPVMFVTQTAVQAKLMPVICSWPWRTTWPHSGDYWGCQ